MIPYFRFCHISPPYRLSENGNARASRIYRRSHFMSIFLQSDLFINACIGLSRYPYQLYNSARSSSTSLIRLHNGPEAQIFTSFSTLSDASKDQPKLSPAHPFFKGWSLINLHHQRLPPMQPSSSTVVVYTTFAIFKGWSLINLHQKVARGVEQPLIIQPTPPCRGAIVSQYLPIWLTCVVKEKGAWLGILPCPFRIGTL